MHFIFYLVEVRTNEDVTELSKSLKSFSMIHKMTSVVTLILGDKNLDKDDFKDIDNAVFIRNNKL